MKSDQRFTFLKSDFILLNIIPIEESCNYFATTIFLFTIFPLSVVPWMM